MSNDKPYSPSFDINKMFEQVNMILKEKNHINIAIDGGAASGKSSLAKYLSKIFPNSNIFHMDDFFLQQKQRTEKRLKEIGGNVDYERFKIEIVDNIYKNTDFEYHPYNCRDMKLQSPVKVKKKPINIIEGAYALHPFFGNIYDIRIFLKIDEDIQKYRILKRNGKEQYKRFVDEWIPKENNYFEHFKIEEKCEFIFKN